MATNDDKLLDEEFDLSEIDEYDENFEKPLSDEKDEAAKWAEQTWEQQRKHVMTLLATNQARWDESGDPKIDLLEEYKKKALTNRDSRERTTPTILHMLAKNFYTDDFQNIPRDTKLKIIKYLLQHRESSFSKSETKYTEDNPILKVAMDFANYEFIQLMITDYKNKLPDLLDAKDMEKMNSLHYAFKTQLPKAMESTQKVRQGTPVAQEKRLGLSETLRMISVFVQEAKPETIAATDKDGNTPIHYALDYKLCRLRIEIYGKMVRSLVKKGDPVLKKETASQFNLENESPYLYYLHTEEKWLKQFGQTKMPHLGEKDSKPGIKDPEKAVGSRGGNFDDAKMDGQDFLEKGGKEQKRKGQGGNMPPPHLGTSENLPQSPTLLAPKREKPSSAPRGAPSKTMDASQGHELSNGRLSYFPGSPTGKSVPSESLVRTQTHAPAQTDNSAELKPLPGIEITSNGKPTAPPKRIVKSLEPKIAAEEIRTFLKLHYIRTRADMEAKELLFGKIASDKNLYFDATTHKGKSAEEVAYLIEKLSKPSGFEDTLSYVNLPVLSHVQDKASTTSKAYSANESKQREGTPQENPMIGRSSLITVFDKLASVQVRNILRLHVDDRDTPAHTDAAIERAIRGRDYFSSENGRKEAIGVELWDWRKLDLSIDVIAFSAPNVAHINLYWSGNQTVLRAWACSEGIPRLYLISEGKLSTVTIYASPGLESRDRMIKMIERFEAEIKERTKDKVKVERKIRIGDPTAGFKLDDDPGVFDAGRSEGPPHHVWVEQMENFRSALISIHDVLKNKAPPSRIKVALIDDGVDLDNLDTYKNIVQATGVSYFPPYGKTERPWHQSTNGHGTIMANMIVRINPWVSLDVMRIQDGVAAYNAGGKTRTIYAESAAKAIRGAIIRKADIISMSWTIKKALIASVGNSRDDKTSKDKKKSPEEIAIGALQEAIDEAKSLKILMFCSAADDIQVVGKDSLPFSMAPDHIFRIGAALPKGQRDPSSEDTNSISYFFPGNQVAEAWNPRSAKTVKYHDGSSVSTALAAGLASLIMYCVNVVKSYHEASTESSGQRASKNFLDDWAVGLRSCENMRKAFNNIEYKEHEDKKFLPVWHVFGKATEQMKNSKGEDKVLALENLIGILCRNID